MRILSFSTDKNLLQAGSMVYARHVRYATEAGDLHCIVFSKGRSGQVVHDDALNIYPTNSRSRLWYGFDAIRLALRLPKPDVITAQDPFETGFAALVASKLLRVPLHVQVHTDFLAPAFSRHSLRNRARVLFARFVLCRAARIRTVSPRIEAGIRARYHLRAEVSVLPIFANIERFRSTDHAKHPTYHVALLFVGRLELEKRADVAIRALALLRERKIDAGLTIVGDGSLKEGLEAFARQQGVAERVVFTGAVDPLPHYARADIVLVPSEYEGYGMVIVEALAAGVPVLATDVGIAKEAGALLAPHDPEGFAERLRVLLETGELPRGHLAGYPYRSEEEYVRAWVDDISRTAIIQA